MFETLKQQAQEFINQEILKRDAERRAEMQREFDQRLAEALASKMMLSPSRSVPVPTVDMNSPGTNDESRNTDRGGSTSLIPRMGTRKNNVSFGKNVPNYIRNQSEMSYENENTLNLNRQ